MTRFLSRNYWSSLDHDLMASIWEKAISILAGSLNSGRRYLITAAPYNLERQTKRSDSKTLPEIMPTTVWVFPQATARVLCMIQSAQFWNKAKGRLQLLVYFWQNCLWVTLINETNYQPNRRQSLHYRSHQEWQWKWGEDGKSVVSAFPAAK